MAATNRLPKALTSLALLLAGCRSSLDLAAATGDAATGCEAPARASVTTAVLDTATLRSEPQASVSVAWTGDGALVTWGRWTQAGYQGLVAEVSRAGGVLLSAPATVFTPETILPGFFAGWNGEALAVVWVGEDGRISLRAFDGHGGAAGATQQLVAGSGATRRLTDLAVDGKDDLLAWSEATGPEVLGTLGRFSARGEATAGPRAVYQVGRHDGDTLVAAAGGRAFAAFSAHEMESVLAPIQSFVGLIDRDPLGLRQPRLVESGMDLRPADLLAGADRIELALFDARRNQATLLAARAAAPWAFTERATVPVANTPRLAIDGCGRLAALLPGGGSPTGNPLVAVSLSLTRLGDPGPTGAPVALPVTPGSTVEQWTLTGADDGFLAAWLEYLPGPALTHRTLQIAYVRTAVP